jgi:hypothetical protein
MSALGGTTFQVLVLSLLIAAYATTVSGQRVAPRPPPERPPQERPPEGLPGGPLGPGALLPANTPLANTIRLEIQKPKPNLNIVTNNLAAIAKREPVGRDSELAELSSLIENMPSEVRAFEASRANVLVRFPTDAAHGLIADYLIEEKVKPALQQTIDRDSMLLMAFPVSSAAKAMLRDQIVPGRQTSTGMLGSIVHGDFETLDAHMFASLRGKTLVVVGHIVYRDGEASFEIRPDQGPRRYLPLRSLLKVSEEVGFNVIPLGCETGEASAIGTASKITDVDGLQGFMRAISRSGTTTLFDLLTDLSGPNLRIVIDPARIRYRRIPIELVDEDGNSYVPPPPADPVPPKIIGTAGPQSSLSIMLASRGKLACEVSPAAVLTASIQTAKMFAFLKAYWRPFLILLLTLFVASTTVESAFADARKLNPVHGQPLSQSETLAASDDIATRAVRQLLVTAGSVFLALGLVTAGYAFVLAIPFGQDQLTIPDSRFFVHPLSYLVFFLLSIIVVEVLAQYRIQRRLRMISNIAKICCIVIGVMLLNRPSEALFLLFSSMILLFIVYTPLVAARVAHDNNFRVTRYVALSITISLLCLVLLQGVWQLAALNCLLVEPRPV